ncbi:hypothetical protein TNCV_140121 [Trichonephila clavipes]|uniref:Uncharacterized protein n=1 Tax=Trichonephila clavipes TaxID=2585209 RepID=A0A8X6RDN1_TRICX|nr:hypothetical protein TNCV_140121 [Trichonephila clavipes]
MKGDQLCVYPSTDDKKGPAYLGQEIIFIGADSDGLLHPLQTSQNSHWRAIRDVYSSGGTVERQIYRGGGIMVWAGISLGGHIVCVPGTSSD